MKGMKNNMKNLKSNSEFNIFNFLVWVLILASFGLSFSLIISSGITIDFQTFYKSIQGLFARYIKYVFPYSILLQVVLLLVFYIKHKLRAYKFKKMA